MVIVLIYIPWGILGVKKNTKLLLILGTHPSTDSKRCPQWNLTAIFKPLKINGCRFPMRILNVGGRRDRCTYGLLSEDEFASFRSFRQHSYTYSTGKLWPRLVGDSTMRVDVPIKNADFPMSSWFSGVYIFFPVGVWLLFCLCDFFLADAEVAAFILSHRVAIFVHCSGTVPWHATKITQKGWCKSCVRSPWNNQCFLVVSGRFQKLLGRDVGPKTSMLPPGGWKLLHADVFRAPKHRLFFCSVSGLYCTGSKQATRNGGTNFWIGYKVGP